MLNLMEIVLFALAAGITTAFLITLMKKWKILDWYDINKPQIMGERCEFCFGFWVSCLLFFPIVHSLPSTWLVVFFFPIATIVSFLMLKQIEK